MNWTAIITALAVITGIYFLWSYLNGAKASPTTQEAFTQPELSGEKPIHPFLVTDPISGNLYAPAGGIVASEMVTNEIPEIVPEKTVTYDTIYNIVVEAPVIPELNTGEIMNDLITEVKEAENDPISQPTGGASVKTSSGSIGTYTGGSTATAERPYVPPETEARRQRILTRYA